MALETGNFIDDLVATNPPGTDQKSQGDDHLRLIKDLVKKTFPRAGQAFFFPDAPAAKTSTYLIVAADDHRLIQADVSGGAFSITFTAVASLPTGFLVTIMKSDSGSNVVTLDPNASETINGATTFALGIQFQAVTLMNTGSSWIIVGDGSPTEIGLWTPTLGFATAGDESVVLSTVFGSYTLHGDLVTLFFDLITSTFTHTTASGTIQIAGLPFLSANVTNQFGLGPLLWQGITKTNYTQITPRLGPNSTTIILQTSGSGQALGNVDTGDMPTGGTVVLRGVLTYKT